MHVVTDRIAHSLKRTFCSGYTILLAACAAATFVGCASPASTHPQKTEPAVPVAKQPATPQQMNARSVMVTQPGANLGQEWGIQVSGLFLSAGGNMVDFRYRVLDPAKASFLTKSENKPQLVDHTSGAKLLVPDSQDLGPLRQTSRPYVAGKIYFMMFANTRHHVKSGDKVTIVVGDFKLEGLTVE
jgi:hypothetical protein